MGQGGGRTRGRENARILWGKEEELQKDRREEIRETDNCQPEILSV